MELESAIPKCLQTPRTVPAQAPPNYKPPYELYAARFPPTTKNLAMAVLGAQYPPQTLSTSAGLQKLSSFLSSPALPPLLRPSFHEAAAVTDARGCHNTALIAYWPSTAAYHEWYTHSGFGEWWRSEGAKPDGDHGWFLEVFLPTADRLETVFTTAVPEGAAHMRAALSGPVREHGYWGSMRDRLAIAQTDVLAGQGDDDDDDDDETARKSADEVPPQQRRVVRRVPGRKNLAVIRSGQDWSAAPPAERALYLAAMQPPLTMGMDYLRDHGDEVGCLSCRFMDVVDPATGEAGQERTFGLAYFTSLAALEGWSRSHRTHLAIFGEFGKFAKRVQEEEGGMGLRLWHEVMVLEAEGQVFEYVGCHEGTGMLGAL